MITTIFSYLLLLIKSRTVHFLEKGRTFCLLTESIEIGLERAPIVVFVHFSPSFEHAKKPADYGPQQHQKLIKKCDFLIFNYE